MKVDLWFQACWPLSSSPYIAPEANVVNDLGFYRYFTSQHGKNDLIQTFSLFLSLHTLRSLVVPPTPKKGNMQEVLRITHFVNPSQLAEGSEAPRAEVTWPQQSYSPGTWVVDLSPLCLLYTALPGAVWDYVRRFCINFWLRARSQILSLLVITICLFKFWSCLKDNRIGNWEIQYDAKLLI